MEITKREEIDQDEVLFDFVVLRQKAHKDVDYAVNISAKLGRASFEFSTTVDEIRDFFSKRREKKLCNPPRKK